MPSYLKGLQLLTAASSLYSAKWRLKALRSDMLDVAVLPVIRVQSGEIVALTNVEMEHVYNRRRVHMEARRNLLSWAIGMCKVGTGFHMTPKIGYAFWDGAEKPPESFMVGLRSAANVFDKAGDKQMPELHTPVTISEQAARPVRAGFWSGDVP